jgi:leader peptidase (prepilin peptidase) / N-methyltransferase
MTLLAATLLAASVTDLRARIIPNALTGTAALAAVALAAGSGPAALAASLGAALLLGLPFALLSLAFPEGFGMGDTKLITVIALFLGWPVLVAVMAGLALAGIAGLGHCLARRAAPSDTALPLAPFLALGTAAVAVAAV